MNDPRFFMFLAWLALAVCLAFGLYYSKRQSKRHFQEQEEFFRRSLEKLQQIEDERRFLNAKDITPPKE